jgi:hypothetical protein
MLLDLARNDVGRVAKIGSVRVVEQFTIEKYSHLQHISSHVEGTLEDGLDAIDALKAGFPAGTLSGAPKVRAMEIIDEVEPVRRGIYAGAPALCGQRLDGYLHPGCGTGLVGDNTCTGRRRRRGRDPTRAEYRTGAEGARPPAERRNRTYALRGVGRQLIGGKTRRQGRANGV